jgi:DNA polymerase III subunit epsilon
MELKLSKPIVFFDLETTGINVVHDRIVEISVLKIHPSGNQESKTMRVNPTIPIPAKVSKIHGIFDKDVADMPAFKEIARTIADFIEGSDLAGYNSNMFDVPLLAEEFLRAGLDVEMKKRRFIDVQVIFHKMEQRTLGAAYKFYCGKSLESAHSAEADTIATYEVLKSQLDRYENLENDMDFLSKFATHHKHADFLGRIVLNSNNEEVFNFGKHKGKKVADVLDREPSYYGWMMDGDFPLYTKKVLTEIRLRKLSEKL